MQALAMDQQYDEHQQDQPLIKYYCRVCNKGFGCGRALGGHMRAHGLITDVVDDDDSCDQTNNSGAFKRVYTLRPNTTRLKTCRVCHNCGKEFLSWKLFLDHARCTTTTTTNDHQNHNNHVASDDDDYGDDGDDDDREWAKGKRSRRTMRMEMPAAASREEEDLAHCLVMLSAARVDPVVVVVEPEESCTSASRDVDDVNHRAAVPRGVFECKACKKVFNSHQALGGHRASHKKVKGCFAGQVDQEMVISTQENTIMSIMALEEEQEMEPLAVLPLRKKGKVHECSICHRVFSSGQALGGHKRCHWITSKSGEPAKVLHMNLNNHQQQQLDLNLPVLRPTEEDNIGLTSTTTRLRLDLPAEIFLQPWMEEELNKKKKKKKSINQEMDDEADSKIKVAKLSELKDVNMSGESSSSWLQVGIGSSTNDTCSDP